MWVSLLAGASFYTRPLTKCQFSLKPHLGLLLLLLFYSSQGFDSSTPVGPQGTQKWGDLSKIPHLVTVTRTWIIVRFQDTSPPGLLLAPVALDPHNTAPSHSPRCQEGVLRAAKLLQELTFTFYTTHKHYSSYFIFMKQFLLNNLV